MSAAALVGVDLLAVAERLGLKPVRKAATDGGEFCAPCPSCGGEDRFLLHPSHASGRGRFWCRGCNTKGDAIDLVKLVNGCDYREAVEWLGISGPDLRPVRLSSNGNGHATLPAGAAARWWEERTRVPWAAWQSWDCEEREGTVAFTLGDVAVTKLRGPRGPKGAWSPSGGPTPPLWPRLPDTLPERLYICEGESDTGILRFCGLDAYALTKGAQSGLAGPVWDAMNARGAHSVVLALDADDAGAKGTAKLVAGARDAGLDVLVLDVRALCDPLLGQKDIRDAWLASGHADPAAFCTRLEACVQPLDAAEFDSGAYKECPAPETNFRSPADILTSAPESVPWRWHGYLADGAITFLGGREKAGKSTLAWELVKALVRGERSFMDGDTTPCPVVMLTEEPDLTISEKLRRHGLGDAGDRLRILARRDVNGRPQWQESISAATAEALRIGAGVLVVDTLSFWASLPEDAENSSGAVLAAFNPLFAASASGLAVLVLHHLARSTGELRGSTAVGANADIIITLSRAPEAPRRRKLDAVGRFMAIPESVLIEWDPEGGYHLLGTGASVTREAREDAVLAVLPDSEPGVTHDDIAVRCGLPARRVSDVLSLLVAAGRVRREGAGRKGSPFLYWREFDSGAGDAYRAPETNSTTSSGASCDDQPQMRLLSTREEA